MKDRIAIVGGGLVGSLLAAHMAKKGYEIDVYERRPDMRKAKLSAGRSINLACSVRGWTALNAIDAEEEIREIAIPMGGRLLHDEEGETSFMRYGKEDEHIYSVSRGDLNKRLMERAEKTGLVKFRFNARCMDVDLDSGRMDFIDEETGEDYSVQYDRVIGTDGAFSAIRSGMMKTDRFNYLQFYIPSGYKELNIPPVNGNEWAIEKNALHIWPRKSYMLIALPNMDGSYTCTLFMPFEGETSFEKLTTDEEVMAFFKNNFPDALKHFPDLIEQWHDNPTSSLVTVRCEPWYYKDKFLIMGDASHAIVPFYGQGMNAGFEDVRIFMEMLENESDWEKLFKEFGNSRKPNADAISALALRNYVEMRDLVADEHFVTKRELSGKINELFPDKWIPLYSMVSFSNIPYAEAIQKGDRQNEILEELVSLGFTADSPANTLKEKVGEYL